MFGMPWRANDDEMFYFMLSEKLIIVIEVLKKYVIEISAMADFA